MQLAQKGEPSSLSAEEFQNIISAMNLDAAQHIAVAVSGGGDSMALTLLLKNWCDERNIKLTALTVDHGLRDNSNAEASQVSKWLSELSIDHHILGWHGDKPTTNIQDQARKARYQLLGKWCADHDIKYLFLAHHREDQAETFLIRLFRGSGIDGLSAMEKMTPFPGTNFEKKYPTLCRPLLDVAKEKLVEVLNEHSQQWIEDPSNKDIKYTRIQIRELLRSSEIEGLDADRLSKTANRMRRVRSLLEEMTVSAETDYVSYSAFGFATVNRKFINELHEEIALRLLSTVIKTVSGATYPPRHKKLETLYEKLQGQDFQGQTFQGQTLAGSMIFMIGADEIIFAREVSAISKPAQITDGQTLLWDNRFLINLKDSSGTVTSISEDHLKKLSDELADFKEKLASVFKNNLIRDRIMPSLPCIIDQDETILLPEMLINKMNLEQISGFSVVFNK
ncbi:MAG: tRNA lysidine(34) synthetase TilS, partial [Kordiimonadaceae bacterium]|jgi:tRNA(Ile)-lysidine synthase|nr:tRNA lysidine(34) synthetase TilS [Kordiimonadaceae bacterium]MBT6329916.1 tRNA lysidine(34) synthetase TilS [Kordiimonadaceae bacterium]MBT7582422.1 tRNA lysidine(34) synthetase TilS [Kordiimonadaceae bacterium]